MQKKKDLADKLRSSGLRPTKQRLRLAEHLFNRSKTFHFTVENLDRVINRKGSDEKVALATIYNTVHAFEKAGHLKEILLKEDLKNSLIISDCEGYEKELFLDNDIVKHLKDTTLLIETHDHVDINISNKLKSYFSNSHKVESIYSLDDFSKLKNYEFSCLKDFDLRTKKEIIFEGRGYIQEWLILYPKQSN